MLAVLGGLAYLERDLIRTRTAEGRSRRRRSAGIAMKTVRPRSRSHGAELELGYIRYVECAHQRSGYFAF
jgi:hypothetical protein